MTIQLSQLTHAILNALLDQPQATRGLQVVERVQPLPAIQTPTAPARQTVVIPGQARELPTKLTSFKIVRVLADGRFVSLVDIGDAALPRVYRIGETLRDAALPEHGGGLYSFHVNPGKLAQNYALGKVWPVKVGSYAILETEVRGPFVGYTTEGECLGYVDDPRGGAGKFAASEMAVVACVARFRIEEKATGYYGYERQVQQFMVTEEVNGEKFNTTMRIK